MTSNFIRLNLNDQTKEDICKDFWTLDKDLEWTYSVESLAKKYLTTKHKLTEVVKNNSSLTVSCEECDCEISQLHNRTDFVKYKSNRLCDNCAEDKKKLNTIPDSDIKTSKLTAMNLAFENEKWNQLNEEYLETLIRISESKTKNEVIKNIFRGADNRSELSKKMWGHINHLEKEGLVWVERNQNNIINNFHILGKLRQKLKESYPDLYSVPRQSSFDRFQFVMQKIRLKKTDNYPDYSGFLNVEKEIMLNPTNEYKYGAWVNDDGTIFIRIEPALKDHSNSFDYDDQTYMTKDE